MNSLQCYIANILIINELIAASIAAPVTPMRHLEAPRGLSENLMHRLNICKTR